MMKNFKLTALFFLTVAFSVSLVAAYDAGVPYTITMKWIIPSDTTFSVAPCGAETSIDFDDNAVNSTDAGVEPDCQDASVPTPMFVITNDGNLNLNFSCCLSATKPAWSTLYVSNDSNYAAATTFDTANVTIADNVASAATADVFIWTDYASATAGTTERTWQLVSEAS